MPIRQDRLSTPTSAAVKIACRVATTIDITLEGLQTIDGVTLVAGDRVLVKEQDDATENGIYVASATAWQRAVDADGNRDFVRGTVCPVYGGSTQVGWYEVTTADPITIGADDIEFTRWLLEPG